MDRPFASTRLGSSAPPVVATHRAVKPKCHAPSAAPRARARAFIRAAPVLSYRRSEIEERLLFLLQLHDPLVPAVAEDDVRLIIEELRRRRHDRKAVVLPASRRSIGTSSRPHVYALVRACEASNESSAIDILRECHRAHYEALTSTTAVVGRSLVCTALGELLLRHRSAPEDISLALHLLDDAVADGHVGAMLEVGLCLRDGVGVPANLPAALAWIERSADAGYAPALFELGVMYEDGADDGHNALDEDWGEARGCYCAAAEKGHVEAQLSLGKLLLKAMTAARNAAPGQVDMNEMMLADLRQSSREWLERAATAGNEEAVRLLRRA